MAKKVSKKRASLLEKIEVEKNYSVDEATALLKELKSAKFDKLLRLH